MDAASIARVHVHSWRATYARVLPESYLAGLSFEDSEARWKEIIEDSEARSFNCVAESLEGEIFGFSSAGPARASENRGWELYAIYLLQSWQGVGLGRKLFAGVLETTEVGTPVITWCISENPSCRFYEALGGESLDAQMTEIGGVSLEETCYGWRDAHELRGRMIAEC